MNKFVGSEAGVDFWFSDYKNNMHLSILWYKNFATSPNQDFIGTSIIYREKSNYLYW